jgi:hypothetical protein
MNHNHAFQIEKLRNNFENIITLKKEIAKVKMLVSDKLSQLKIVYNELIKTNNKKIFLFCLDSFYFQYKTFSMEMEHIDRYRALMNNRMYCDYYKLYNIIITHIKDNRSDMNVSELELKTYPAYKDLEPFQEYKLEDIKEIHANILFLINQLYGQTLDKNDVIEHYNDNHRIGFSISNFLNTLEYENRLLREQVGLYINYVSFFHISERKQLNRLFLRMQEFYKEVEENININRTFSIDDIGDEDKLNRFYIVGEDVKIDPILEDIEFLEVIQKEKPQIAEPEPLIEIENPKEPIENNEKTSEIVENNTDGAQPTEIANVFDEMTHEQPVDQPIEQPIEVHENQES